METSTIIWIVVLVVIALILIGLVMMMRGRNREANRSRAEQLREQADSRATTLPEDRARADEAAAAAERKRLEAERAEREATEARVAADQQDAMRENKFRAADRLDPDVDHTSSDYRPNTHTGTTGTTGTTAGTAGTTSGTDSVSQGGTYDESGRPVHDTHHDTHQESSTVGGTRAAGAPTDHYDADGRLITDPDYAGPRYDAHGREIDSGGGSHRA